MSVHDGHRERMRKIYLGAGASALSDINMLEMLLYYALPRIDTNELAHALIEHFGSLSAVLGADAGELCRVKGVGENTAVLIKLAGDISGRARAERFNNIQSINSSADAGAYFIAKIGSESREKAVLLCLDSRNKVLKLDEICSGSVNSVNVDIRLVAESALRSKATSVIFAHNHPDGYKFPSNEDIRLTRNMDTALRGIGVVMADHIIATADDYYSFADNDQL